MWGTCLVLLTRGHDTKPEERKLSNCVGLNLILISSLLWLSHIEPSQITFGASMCG